MMAEEKLNLFKQKSDDALIYLCTKEATDLSLFTDDNLKDSKVFDAPVTGVHFDFAAAQESQQKTVFDTLWENAPIKTEQKPIAFTHDRFEWFTPAKGVASVVIMSDDDDAVSRVPKAGYTCNFSFMCRRSHAHLPSQSTDVVHCGARESVGRLIEDRNGHGGTRSRRG